MDWESWRDAYLKWFNAAGISSVAEYLTKFDNYETEQEVLDDISDEQFDLIDQMGLHGFERGATNQNQDVAFININPQLVFPTSPLQENTCYQMGSIDKSDVTTSQELGPEKGLGWLVRDGHPGYLEGIFVRLIQAGYLSEEFSNPSESRVNDLKSSIYYTNWFKYASNGQKLLQQWLNNEGGQATPPQVELDIPLSTDSDNPYRIPNGMLEQEIHAVNPDVVLVFGSKPWKHFFLDQVDPWTGENNQKAPLTKTASKVHGRAYRYETEQGNSSKVIPLYHPTRGIKINHTELHDGEEIERAIEVTNNRLSQSLTE